MAAAVAAVTGPTRGARAPRALVAVALRLHGMRALQLAPGTDIARRRYDAVVVTGGHDIDPVLYAAEPEVEPRHDTVRDRFEMRVIDDALARGLPLLGICRGAQLLNVCCGGSLFQDLKRSHRTRTSSRRTVLPLQRCLIEPGTRVAALIGSRDARVNNLHNQAVDRLGDGLVVSARDLDGIVQAVEARGERFIVGVQWHPEFLLPIPRQLRLFAGLARAAAAG